VFNAELTKPGHKKFIGWGSVKENIIAAYLQQTGIIDDFRASESVKVFDPFCGSGTILLESLLATINYPIRYERLDALNFNNWPIVAKNAGLAADMAQYIARRREEYNKTIKVSAIGCDISINQLNNAIQNFKHLERLDIIKSVRLNDNSVIIGMKNALSAREKKTRSFKNKVLLAHCSFAEVSAHADKLEGYTLITNVPYGSNYSQAKLGEIYAQFDDFLEAHHALFKKIVILCPNNLKNAYIVRSRFQWNIELDFYNGKYKMGFFAFTPERNMTQPLAPEYVVHEKVVKRSRKSNVVVKTKILLSKLKAPNSKKAKDVIEFARTKKRNEFLKSQKEYEAQKTARIRGLMARADERKALAMQQKINELMGDSATDAITKLIKP